MRGSASLCVGRDLPAGVVSSARFAPVLRSVLSTPAKTLSLKHKQIGTHRELAAQLVWPRRLL